MLKRAHHRRISVPAIAMISIYTLMPCTSLVAQDGEEGDPKTHGKMSKLKGMLDGFTVGRDTYIFPYASLEDWFDPYGGLKIEHSAAWRSDDRVSHHIKFETFRDYSWKFRYLANSISRQNTKFSFLFKLKFDRDAFYYGVGNATLKSARVPATYSSVFFGTEIRQVLSSHVVLDWSPGFWSFQSGLLDGREFELAANAHFFTSRLTLRDRNNLDYRAHHVVNQWSTYAELGLPTNDPISRYVRFNVETLTRIPLRGDLKLAVGGRSEYLISPDRDLVPYFALPEAGSRSGLRGFSKERFRNFALNVLNLELAYPIQRRVEAFLLSDLGQTGRDPLDLFGNKIHHTLGFGLRLLRRGNPISGGFATGGEGWKLFSNISAALSF